MLQVIGLMLLISSIEVFGGPGNFGYFEKSKYLDDWLNSKRTCGYEGCPNSIPDMLNVHVVPHTHDDVGWLKTVDQYYYGSKNTIQKAGVQYIIDSVVQELLSDPQKRFIYVESAFFFKWWDEQTDRKKEQVKELVDEGRLEFIGGAWSMNDEAATHYQCTIDQFTWGLRMLNDTFGECGRPRIGWQIDPFGHSREMASLFAQMGYDGLFIGRIDFQDKSHRLGEKNMEMIWHGSENLGEKADIFTGALFNTYSPPPGYCFDILCADEPIIDDKRSPDYNVDRRVNSFLAYVQFQARVFRTNNIILTMGGDFTYMDANSYYKNLDKLIRYANELQKGGSKINLFYSTPSCYLKSLHDAHINWPSKTDDFFPYASDPHALWTGYFTSRPTLKRFERMGNHFLQVCKQLSAFTSVKVPNFNQNLNLLREAMGIMQHHDAVTGTEKQKVADDYARIVDEAIDACRQNTKETLNQLTFGNRYNYFGLPKFDYDNCLTLNISECFPSDNSNNFMITLYNPLAHSTFQYVRVPVPGKKYLIKDYRGIEILNQMVPISEAVKQLNYRHSNSVNELTFLATELPPIGFKSYFVSRLDNPQFQQKSNIIFKDEVPVPEVIAVETRKKRHGYIADMTSISNKHITINFDSNGLLASVQANGVTQKVSQKFYYYEGAKGNNQIFKNRSSGAYIFRPNDTEILVNNKAEIKVVQGLIVNEVHQKFNGWISQIVRLYKDENHIEFEWMIGDIPIIDNVGKEIITRFETDIKSNGVFYTDANGREMIKRVRNFRETWDLQLDEPIAGNYYPVTAKIAIEDDDIRLAVMNDRAQGGSSLIDGSIELMLHRRLLYDDGFGVGEALNEHAYGKGLIARGQLYLTIGPKAPNSVSPQMEAQERFIQLEKLLPSWIFASNANFISYDDWRDRFTHIFSGISLSLPKNIHLLTYEPWKERSILIRFEHILAANEDPIYSKSVVFNLKDVFKNLDISEIRETTLAGNQWLDESKRLKFKEENVSARKLKAVEQFVKNNVQKSMNNDDIDDTIVIGLSDESGNSSENKIPRHKGNAKGDDDQFTIILEPMEIRTFIIEMEYRP